MLKEKTDPRIRWAHFSLKSGLNLPNLCLTHRCNAIFFRKQIGGADGFEGVGALAFLQKKLYSSSLHLTLTCYTIFIETPKKGLDSPSLRLTLT